jgi:hypothetical protein
MANAGMGGVLGELDRRVRVLERARGLGHQTIVDAALPVVDQAGVVQQVIGKQTDGTFAVVNQNGAVPVAPKGLTVTAGVGGGQATWDGTLAGEDLSRGIYMFAPSDFARVEFHISTEGPDFIPDVVGSESSTLFAAVETTRGGTVVAYPLPPVQHFVKIVTRTLSGKFSAASPAASFTPLETTSGGTDNVAPVLPAGWAPVLAPLAVGALAASWDAVPNADPVTYSVYLDSAPVDGTNPATFFKDTTQTSLALWQLPDGSAMNASTGYYIAVTVRDSDGPAIGYGAAGPVAVRVADQDLIAADYIYGGLLEARQIKSGTIDAALAIAQEIFTATTGRRIGLSSNDGLTAVDTNGDTVISLPTDMDLAIQLNAHITAKTMTAEGAVAFRAPDNEIAAGANVIMRQGTSAPVTPPTVSIGWNTQRTAPDETDAGFMWSGYIDGEDLIAANGGWGYGAIQRRSRTNGTFIENVLLCDPYNFVPVSVVKLAGYYYTLGFYGDRGAKLGNAWSSKWYVTKWLSNGPNVNGTRISEWEYAATADTYQRAPAMGTDGTYLLLCRADRADGNKVKITKYNADSGTVPSGGGTFTIDLGFAGDVGSIMLGTFDFGVTRYVITFRNASGGGDYIRVFTAAGTRDTTREWPTANTDSIALLAWDPTDQVFRHASKSDNIYYTYDGDFWVGANTRTQKITHTWVDADTWVNPTTGVASEVHETGQGPPATIAMKKRANFTVTTPPIPVDLDPNNHDDATRTNLYVGSGTGVYNTQFLQASPPDMVRTVTITKTVLSNADTLHPNPPQFGNFPQGVPGKVVSDDFNYWFDAFGDAILRKLTLGTGTIRRLKFGTNNISVNSSTSGTVSIPHGLGAFPQIILATAKESSAWNVSVPTWDGTNVTLACQRCDGGGSVSATISVMWLALY